MPSWETERAADRRGSAVIYSSNLVHSNALRPSDVIQRTTRGVVSLGGGQVAAQILNIGGMLLLARVLAPAEFGLVAILTFLLALLTAIGDLGLGMSLVRRPQEPTEAEYRTVASFQQTVAGGVVLVACAATPLVVREYGLPRSDWWLLPMMAGAILADSVRFLPLARLERRLAFPQIGAVEVAQAIAFNGVLLPLAMRPEFRGQSFPIAVLARSITGALLAISLGPRSRGWGWDWPSVKPFLAFGLPYQGVNVITVARNSIVPVFVGLLLGRAAVGRLAWAVMVAGFPLTGLILFQRLYVGSFGRLQQHPAELREFVRRLVAVAHGVVAPLAVVTLVLIDPIVRLAFGTVWLSAVPLVFWLWLGCLAIPTLAPLTGLLHALGHSRVVFRVTLAATIATWVLGVPLVLAFGEVGIAIASLAVHVAGLAIWRTARRAVPFRVFWPAVFTWACAAIAGVAVWWLQAMYPVETIPQLIVYGIAALVVYVAIVGAGSAMLFWSAWEGLGSDVWRRPTAAFRFIEK